MSLTPPGTHVCHAVDTGTGNSVAAARLEVGLGGHQIGVPLRSVLLALCGVIRGRGELPPAVGRRGIIAEPHLKACMRVQGKNSVCAEP